jgi:hypothetical protein
MDALREAGIPFELEQTGGWCMAVSVRAEQSDYCLVTTECLGTADLGWYPSEQEASEEEVFATVDLADLPATVRAWMAGDRP